MRAQIPREQEPKSATDTFLMHFSLKNTDVHWKMLTFHWKTLSFTKCTQQKLYSLKAECFTAKYWNSVRKAQIAFFHWKILTFSEMQWKSYTFLYTFFTAYFTAIYCSFTAYFSEIQFFQWNHWQKLVQISVANTLRRVFFTEIMIIYYWHNQLYFSCFHSNSSTFHWKISIFQWKVLNLSSSWL